MLDKKKTVFILGAGASCPYGYPSGAQLRKQICSDIQKLSRYFSRTYPDPVRKEKIRNIQHFIDTFSKSGTKSIDLFLARNPNLATTGKYIIAFEILDSERLSNFNESAIEEQDWYFYFFNRITESLTSEDTLPDFTNGNISFVTFNYDRSLEYYLYESLRHSYTGIHENEINNCLNGLKILHIYGQIASLEWQKPQDFIEYAPKVDETLLEKATKNIRTIYEEEKAVQLKEARELIKAAQRIIFLGFGYAQENMDLLQLPRRIPRECSVYGTAYGLEGNEIKQIRDYIIKGLLPGPGIGKNPERVLIEDMDCLKLLRNYL